MRAFPHSCRLPRLRWIGREWTCRCGQKWCYIMRGDRRFDQTERRWWAPWGHVAATSPPTTQEEAQCPAYDDGRHRSTESLIPASYLACKCGYRGPYNPDRFA